MNIKVLLPTVLVILLSACSDSGGGKTTSPRRIYEDEGQAVLGRGVVSSFGSQGQLMLNWRLLPDDPTGTVFNIYRKEVGSGDDTYRLIGRTDRTSYKG